METPIVSLKHYFMKKERSSESFKSGRDFTDKKILRNHVKICIDYMYFLLKSFSLCDEKFIYFSSFPQGKIFVTTMYEMLKAIGLYNFGYFQKRLTYL